MMKNGKAMMMKRMMTCFRYANVDKDVDFLPIFPCRDKQHLMKNTLQEKSFEKEKQIVSS